MNEGTRFCLSFGVKEVREEIPELCGSLDLTALPPKAASNCGEQNLEVNIDTMPANCRAWGNFKKS